MPAYDAQRFSPPVPLAQVICKNLDTGVVLAGVPMIRGYVPTHSRIPELATIAVFREAGNHPHQCSPGGRVSWRVQRLRVLLYVEYRL